MCDVTRGVATGVYRYKYLVTSFYILVTFFTFLTFFIHFTNFLINKKRDINNAEILINFNKNTSKQ